MLQLVEFHANERQATRRGVALTTAVIATPRDLPRQHRILDLSEDGLRVAAGTRLPIGEAVVVSFTPPGWWIFGELTLFARVRRETERGKGGGPATMGMEFIDLPKGLRIEMKRSLRGLPPPIPTGESRVRRELVWVEVLMTYTEDLGDRVNTFEVSERLQRIDDAEIVPRSLGRFVTGGKRPFRWRSR